MPGQRSARASNVAARAVARLSRRLELVNDLFNPNPDPLKDTFENAFFIASSHGHLYGGECSEAYCVQLRTALIQALPQLGQAVVSAGQQAQGGR